MSPRLARQLLCIASLFVAAAATDTDAHTGRDLLATSSVTVTATIQDACEVETAYGNLEKNAAGYRGSCSTPAGVAVPCSAVSSDGGAVNYTVNQGDSLTVTLKGASSTYVFTGGSLNDGFLDGSGCFLKTTTTPVSTPIVTASIASFTFNPTGAVCSQFYNNTKGTLSVLAFDTYYAEQQNGAYYAASCKFNIGVNINPSPSSQLSPNQLFPLTGGAEALSGSMLKMVGVALLAAIAMLVMLQ